MRKMRIDDIGGEFTLIERLCAHVPAVHKNLLAGIGDDAAVIGGIQADGSHLLVTTDMLVENSHFKCEWAAPEQIGIKSVVCNVSDIAAMGGTPTFMFVSLALPPTTEVEWAESLYRGMGRACRRYGVILAGGDTTHGAAVTINIALLGRVAPENLCLRSHARPGDLLCVTGPVGTAAAGLAMMSAGFETPDLLKEKHLMPGCRLDVSPAIAPLAHAMIDISDGLAAEVNHICKQSKTGAEIVAADIPLHPLAVEAARLTENDPLSFALAGGEDFELLFSITPQNRQQLERRGIDIVTVGKVTDAAAGIFLRMPDGKSQALAGGYNHFS
jgi:thiamine-monophosphate kinase